jgi:hypothetical protein
MKTHFSQYMFDIYHDLNSQHNQRLSASRQISLIALQYQIVSEEIYYLGNELSRLLTPEYNGGVSEQTLP